MINRFLHRLCGCILAAGMIDAGSVHAATPSLPAAAPGLVEAGAPPFSVRGVESLPLNSAPTDLHVMPDGRILLLAADQLALGDGVRWQSFSRDPSDARVTGLGAAVGTDGRIYLGTPDGVGVVVFGGDGRWRLDLVTPWAAGESGAVALTQSTCTMGGREWFWHSLSGPIVSWRPDATPRVVASSDTFEHVFEFQDAVHLSERFNGRLTTLRGAAAAEVTEAGTSAAITCTQPVEAGRILAGTYGAGVQWFDGSTRRPITSEGPLAGGARINALCATEGGYFAAAVDNLGVVFFDREGRTIQALDRSLDRRLARVTQLRPAAGGTVWGLLEDGVVRIEFPTPVSSFEPLIGTGITTVHPYRADGRLWLLADGKLHRAVYDADGRLLRFDLDTPARLFVNSFSAAPGMPVAGTEKGAFFRTDAGWQPFAPDTNNLRILDQDTVPGRWLYAAHDEAGWLTAADGRPAIAGRVPVPGLTNSFNRPIVDQRGRNWLELGSGRLASVRVEAGRPVVDLPGSPASISPSWPQIFAIDGRVGVNFAETLFWIDEATGGFVRDADLVAALPGVRSIFGRPGIDGLDRLWATADGSVRVFERRDGGWQARPEPVPVDFSPYYFTFEEGGVVWMHAQHRFARFDPAITGARPLPVRARITHVAFTAHNRHEFSPGAALPPVAFEDNSLIVFFVAHGHTSAAPASFEAKLEGAGGDWFGTGIDGSTTLNHLREGSYVLRVRPRTSAGLGEEASLAFTIRPPWFRTSLAYGLYAAGAVGFVLAVVSGWSWLGQREQTRLARLVAERTAELRRSEEKYRRLSGELEIRVERRTHELHQANEHLSRANRELEVSNSELESFSYSISHDLRSPLRGIDGWSLALLEDCGDRLDQAGRDHLARVRAECQRLSGLIDDLLKLSRTTRAEWRAGPVELSALVTGIAARVAASWPQVRTGFSCQPGLQARGDAALLEAALTNLLDNAWKFSARVAQPRVEFGLTDTARGPAFFVRDNGAGFDMRHARKLFGVFQRMHTQEEFPGTGVGLATVQRIIHRHGGSIWAESVPGSGATFYFTLPLLPATPPP